MAVPGVTSFLERQAARLRGLPRGARVVLGLVPIVVGALVVLRPFASLTVLIVLIAVALAIDGAARLAGAPRSPHPVVAIVVGLVQIVAAILVVAWPVVAVLAVVVGVAVQLVLTPLFPVVALFGIAISVVATVVLALIIPAGRKKPQTAPASEDLS